MDDLNKKEDRANTIFYVVLILLIIISVGITFYKIVILKNYQIVAQVSCNPATEKCFESICDPAEDEKCPENVTERTSYYKNISKKANTIYVCEMTEEKLGCNKELSCTEGEASCSYTYCNPVRLSEGEKCSE